MLKQSNINQTAKTQGRYTCIFCGKHEVMKDHLETKRHKDANIIPNKMTNVVDKKGVSHEKEIPNVSSKEVCFVTKMRC